LVVFVLGTLLQPNQTEHKTEHAPPPPPATKTKTATTSNPIQRVMAEAEDYGFAPDEMLVNENLGYPKAFAKLCRDRGFSTYSHGPPFTFIPYALQEQEVKKKKKRSFSLHYLCLE